MWCDGGGEETAGFILAWIGPLKQKKRILRGCYGGTTEGYFKEVVYTTKLTSLITFFEICHSVYIVYKDGDKALAIY